MLTSYNAKSFLPVAIRRQLFSPSVSPALSHAVREVAAPNVIRRKSSAPAVVGPVAFPTPLSRFFDADDFFARPFASAFDLHPLFKQFDLLNEERRDRFFSPGYQISSDTDNVHIAVDLPGVKMEDIDIKLKDDKLLQITGGRKVEKDGYVSELRFDKRFNLGANLDSSGITANLSEGVLTITSPKIKPTPVEENVKKIKITQIHDEGRHKFLRDEEVEC